MKKIIIDQFDEHLGVSIKSKNNLIDDIVIISKVVIKTIKSGNKLIFCGNGGSAADSQHIAAEFVGRFKKERKGLPAIAITTDTSIITAIGNDYGYDKTFQRQIESIANKGDLLFGITTSGNSLNVINGIKAAKKIGCKTVGFSGNNGGEMKKYCDLSIIVPSNDTARIQEIHILIGHIICEITDQKI